MFYIARNLVLMTILMMNLLLCGDISENPGPSVSFSSDTSTTESINNSFFSNNANSYVSLLHLNIQSLKPKINKHHYWQP